MPIGHFMAKNLYDAEQFCLLINLMLMALGLWGLNRYDLEDSIPETQARLRVQTFGATVGLAAVVVVKAARKYVAIGVILAVCAAAIFAFSATSSKRAS